MKFSISQPELLKAIESVSGVISKVKPVNYGCLANVLIEVKGNKATFSTFNLQWGAIASSEDIEDTEDGAVCIPCLLFLKLVKQLKKGDRLTLRSVEDNLEILRGNARNVIAGIDRGEMVCFPVRDANLPTYSISSEQLKEGITKVLPIIPSDRYSRFDVVFLKIAESVISFTGTNGEQMIEYAPEYAGVKSTKDNLNTSIPCLVAGELKRILAKSEEMLTASVASIEPEYSWISGNNFTIFFAHKIKHLPLTKQDEGRSGFLKLEGKELVKSLERFKALFDKKSLVDFAIEPEGLKLTQTLTETLCREDETRYESTVLKATEWLQGITEGEPLCSCLVSATALIDGVKQMGKEVSLSIARMGDAKLLLVECDRTKYILTAK